MISQPKMEVRETSNFLILLHAVCFARLRFERAQPTSVCLHPKRGLYCNPHHTRLVFILLLEIPSPMTHRIGSGPVGTVSPPPTRNGLTENQNRAPSHQMGRSTTRIKWVSTLMGSGRILILIRFTLEALTVVCHIINSLFPIRRFILSLLSWAAIIERCNPLEIPTLSQKNSYACDYKGKYVISPSRRTWPDAKTACEAAGLTLAMVCGCYGYNVVTMVIFIWLLWYWLWIG